MESPSNCEATPFLAEKLGKQRKLPALRIRQAAARQ
jgi:hypothetical protein